MGGALPSGQVGGRLRSGARGEGGVPPGLGGVFYGNMVSRDGVLVLGGWGPPNALGMPHAISMHWVLRRHPIPNTQ